MNAEIQTIAVECADAQKELAEAEALFSDRSIVTGEIIDSQSIFYRLSERTQEHLLSCHECWERYEAIPTHL